MDFKQQLLMGLPVLLAPILIDLGVGALRRKPAYRASDLVTNLTLSLLTLLASVGIAGATLWLYTAAHQHFGLLPLAPGAAWTWLLAFLAYDFLYYWAHRAHHRMAWLWAIHVVHHSGEDMNFGLAVRQSALGELTTWPFFLPMALLGIPPEAYLGATALQLVFQYSIHNTYVPPLGWLERVLVTPSQHRVHHSRNRLYIDKNYGNVLVLWDWLFGSYQPEVPEQPPVYGIRHSPRTWNPLTLHVHALVELLQKAAACERWLDKARCVLRPPDWEPPSLRRERFPGLADDGPSATFRKYEARLAPAPTAYCVSQFLALAASIVLLIWKLEALSAPAVAAACALVLWSAWTLGTLLDARPGAWRLELVRLAAVALFGLASTLPAGLALPFALPFLLYAALSGAFLLRVRAAFQEALPSGGPGALAT
ncbi:MAG TPA: sterol desaturase family protein [Myxococcus sp.]|nr:sterol desaturase family protein [Myxococcus sp.]